MAATDPPDAPGDPGSADEPPTPGRSRRDRRTAKRARAHRRRRQVVGIALTIVVLAAGTAVATDAVRLSSQDKPQLSRSTVVADGSSHSTSTSTTLPNRTCKPNLTSADPLKVWVGGDSLAGSLGPAFGTIAGATGVVQPYFHSRVSSGLSTPQFVDWPALATKEMASVAPDIVVFIIGTNDYPVAMDKTVDSATGEPTWKASYGKLVDNMLSILEGSGRTVIWLGAPVLRDPAQNESIKAIDAVEQAIVKQHRNAEYVDTYSLFADPTGKFSTTVVDDEGKTITARAGDGIHFTTDGANYLARAVFKLVDAQCHVTAQAVPGQIKQTIQTPGSTQVAPGSGSSSGSSSGGGPIVTTPPATQAPATQPPATQPQATQPQATQPQATQPTQPTATTLAKP
jgi:hypothetical protein